MGNAPNSLRPVRVGVDGSISGVALKVTVFAGVRANSLAMNKRQEKVNGELKTSILSRHLYPIDSQDGGAHLSEPCCVHV